MDWKKPKEATAGRTKITAMVLMLALAVMPACSEDPVEPAGEAGIDLASADISQTDLPGKDAPADNSGDTGLLNDLTADGDSGGKDMTKDTDKGATDLADLGGDVGSDKGTDMPATDGVSADGSSASGYKLSGEITSAAGVCSGGGYTLVSQIGHPMDTQTVTGGGYTLRLLAVVTR